MQLHAERAQFGWEAVHVVQAALEEGRCALAGVLLICLGWSTGGFQGGQKTLRGPAIG